MVNEIALRPRVAVALAEAQALTTSFTSWFKERRRDFTADKFMVNEIALRPRVAVALAEAQALLPSLKLRMMKSEEGKIFGILRI